MLSVSFHPFLWRNRLYPLTLPAGKRLQVGAMTSLIPPTSCGQTGPSLGDGGGGGASPRPGQAAPAPRSSGHRRPAGRARRDTDRIRRHPDPPAPGPARRLPTTHRGNTVRAGSRGARRVPPERRGWGGGSRPRPGCGGGRRPWADPRYRRRRKALSPGEGRPTHPRASGARSGGKAARTVAAARPRAHRRTGRRAPAPPAARRRPAPPPQGSAPGHGGAATAGPLPASSRSAPRPAATGGRDPRAKPPTAVPPQPPPGRRDEAVSGPLPHRPPVQGGVSARGGGGGGAVVGGALIKAVGVPVGAAARRHWSAAGVMSPI